MAIVYDMPIDDYHKSPRISASKVKDFDARGPRYYHQSYVGRVFKRELTDALIVGQAFEDLLTEPKVFEQKYAAKPEGMDFRTKDGKAWREAQESVNRLILSWSDVAMLRAMAEAVLEHPIAPALISAARKQVTLTSELFGTPGLQSRPDWLCLEGHKLTGGLPYSLDLKTCDDIDKLINGRSVVAFGYDIQAAMVRMTAEKNGVRGMRNLLLGVEKQTPHRVEVFALSEAFMERGVEMAMRTCEAIADCYATSEWPRTSGTILTVEPPRWAHVESSYEAA